jgi:hypothetical protein
MYANKLALAIHAALFPTEYSEQQRREDEAWARQLYQIKHPNVMPIYFVT